MELTPTPTVKGIYFTSDMMEYVLIKEWRHNIDDVCSTFKQSHLFNSYDKYCYSLTLFTFLNPCNVNKVLKNTKALHALSKVYQNTSL